MNEYTASNGVKIESNLVGLGVTVNDLRIVSEETEALREFFRAETDERLGRWRHPVKTWYVVHRGAEGLRVVDERDATVRNYSHDGKSRDGFVGPSNFRAVVDAYLAAHTEPKPWEGAEPGELWSVTTLNQEGLRCFVVHDDPIAFVTTDDTHHLPASVVVAHRIYPPADPS